MKGSSCMYIYFDLMGIYSGLMGPSISMNVVSEVFLQKST